LSDVWLRYSCNANMSLRTKFTGLKEILAFDNRAWLAVTKILFPRERLHVYRYRGMQILTDHDAGDANGAREILTSPMYRTFLPEMKFDGPANVLDLGGNNGGFPLLLNAEDIELKKVVSVELNPQTFVRLHFNLHRNLACETEAVNAAVCGANGKLNVRLGRGDVSDNIYSDHSGSTFESCDIDGFTFDEIFEKHFGDGSVDVCKIDIEGAEFDVFRSPHHQRLRNCRYLIMEIHERSDRRAEEIIPVIEALGFSHQPTKLGGDPTVHFFIANARA